MNKIEIFNKKIIEIITNYDETIQLKFLKIYLALKPTERIIDIWLNIYTDIMNQIQILNSPELQTKKINTIKFIATALLHNLIEYKTAEIFKLLDYMKKINEEDIYIDLVKTNVLTGRSRAGIRKIQSSDLTQSIADLNIDTESKPDSKTESKTTSKSDSMPKLKNIRDFSAKEIALELTMQSTKMLKHVTHHELIHISQNDNYAHDEENILPSLKMIYDFRKLSFMVPTIILIEDKNNMNRIKTIKHLLAVCDELKHLHNYHSLFAIIAGLNNNAVQRISDLWKPKTAYFEHFTDLSRIISPINNYGKYREVLRKDEKTNLIPYIGVTISDIKHLLEYNLYDLDTNDFDSYMCDKLLEIIENFKNTQHNYKIKPNNQLSEWFLSFKNCDNEDYLYEISSAIKNDTQLLNIDTSEKSRMSSKSEDSKSSSKSDEPKSPNRLSLNKNFKIFQSSRSMESPKSKESGSSESPKSSESPRFAEPSRSRASSKSKESPRPKEINTEIEFSIKPIESDIKPTGSDIKPTESDKNIKIPSISIDPTAVNSNHTDLLVSLGKNKEIVDPSKNQKNTLRNKKMRKHKSLYMPSILSKTTPDVYVSSPPEIIPDVLMISPPEITPPDVSVISPLEIISPEITPDVDVISPPEITPLGLVQLEIPHIPIGITNGEDIMSWTTSDVTQWLQIIGLEIYCDIFAKEEINGFVLLELTNDNLKNDLHIEKLGHRLTILKSISLLKI